MNRSMNVYEELRRTKRDLKRLRSAMPHLMLPEDLLDRFVTKCRDVMLYSSIGDKLHHDAENFEIQFLNLRHSLRTLSAAAPLLVATGKTSAAAWVTMLEQPQ
ncbi:hypothetical protein ANCCAN_10139 [Ancylostoma caninum]|uniref:Uncharacterized protein n=1 Tax=Ancylostoma caninum TaxID=29170 RepID=A0A368GLU6_ANCCA|nr:hypothetical protein ANCCAN_10139 [Ancylostoma caninum]